MLLFGAFLNRSCRPDYLTHNALNVPSPPSPFEYVIDPSDFHMVLWTESRGRWLDEYSEVVDAGFDCKVYETKNCRLIGLCERRQ